MKYLKKIIIGVIVLIIVGGIVLEYNIPTPSTFPKEKFSLPILIAHAAGAIDGNTYTNSKEALENAKDNQYQFIELDLTPTSDGRIAAIHEMDQFNSATGFDSLSNNDAIDSKDFSTRKIYGKYQTLLDDSINSFFNRNKNLFFVTDKITDLDLLEDKISVDKDRMLVEVFSYKDYIKALKKGYKYPMLSIWDREGLEYYKYHMLLGKVKIIATYDAIIDEEPEALKKAHDMGVAIFVYTANDKYFISKYGKDLITGFYTDSVTYSMLPN